MRYAEKLKDPRWQRKRLEIFQRDNFTCLASGATDEPLCVHHMRYHGDPWDTPDDELETVCLDVNILIEPFAKYFRRQQVDYAMPGRIIWKALLETESLRRERGKCLFADEPDFWKVEFEVIHRATNIASNT